MKLQLALLAAQAILVHPMAVTTRQTPFPGANITETCDPLQPDPSLNSDFAVWSCCRYDGGRNRATGLKTGGCLSNDNGVLRVNPAGNRADHSCASCELLGKALRCKCPDDKGVLQESEVDLVSWISN